MQSQRGLFAAALAILACAAPTSAAPCTDTDGDGYFYEAGCGTAQDCNDASATTHPGAVEACDGYDNDCDGILDNADSCSGVCTAPQAAGDPLPLTTNAVRANVGPRSTAWTGQLLGVAWQDRRDGNDEIYFAALDAQGTIIFPERRITADSGESTYPSLVWTGTEYGLAWSEGQPGNKQVFFMRLAADGTPLTNPVRVSDGGPGNFTLVSLCWTGSGFGLAWTDSNALEAVYFGRLTPTGASIGSPSRLTGTEANNPTQPSLAWTGTGYGLAWSDERFQPLGAQILFVQLDREGLRVSPDRRVSRNDYGNGSPAVVWTGIEFGVAWAGPGPSGWPNVTFSRVSPDGVPQGDEARLDIADGYGDAPSIAWTGEEFGVGWRYSASTINQWRVMQQRFDATGVPIGPSTEVGASPANVGQPNIVWLGSSFAMTWTADQSGEYEVYYTEVLCSCYRTFFRDSDNDGFGDPTETTSACQLPSGFVSNGQDCDDENAAIHPGAVERCNGSDDNCDGRTDDDAVGLDTDADAVANACDNCRFAFNPDQLDSDGDLVGNSCDNCALLVNADQADADSDQRGNACDNCVNAYNPLQDDFDADRAGDACDNCVFDWNATQSNSDADGQGDLCDLDDGLIYIYSTDRNYREWQSEAGYSTWNSYRGSLSVLKATGAYTQVPGSNPAAARDCGLTDPWVFDDFAPATAEPLFFLTTGNAGGVESGLGTNSAGTPRSNAAPCP